MTPEQIATLMEYAQEVDKSITDTRRMAVKAVITGHLSAITGLSLVIPADEATRFLDECVEVLEKAKARIGDAK